MHKIKVNTQQLMVCIIIALSFGCATSTTRDEDFKWAIQNTPGVDHAIGHRVFVEVGVEDKEWRDARNTVFGKTILYQARQWLTAHGYNVVDKKRSADLAVVFTANSQDKTLHVPGATYVRNGPYAQSVQTSEGYNTDVTARYLFLAVWQQQRGKTPEIVTDGQIFPREYRQKFFEEAFVMSDAVTILFDESLLGKYDKAFVANDLKDPGCWMRLGMDFVEENLTRGARIKSFLKGSHAEKAGLKVGDIVYSIADVEVPNRNPAAFAENEAVDVSASRDGKAFSVKVMPSMQCIN